MLRKTVITATILSALCSSTVFAREMYLGIGLGPDYAKFQKNSNISQVLDGRLEFNAQDDNQFSGTGTFGTIFAGMGTRFKMPYTCTPNQDGYLALELNANRSTLKYTMSNDELVHSNFSTTIYRMNHAYGVSLLPGYVYHDATLFYGRLGYARGDLRIITADATIGNSHQYMDGFRWGLGLRQMLSKQFAVRMEYSHVGYRNISLSTLSTNNVAKSTHITPQTNEVEFSIMYLFC
jgi:outer membrane immunogenic protein